MARVMGHSIEEQAALMEQFDGLVDQALHQTVDLWIKTVAGEALTAAADPFSGAPEHELAQIWQKQVDGNLSPFIYQTYESSSLLVAHEVASHAGVGVPSLPNNFGAHYVSQVQNKMVGISNDLWKNIRAGVAEGVKKNETIPQIADRVRHAAAVTEPRAHTVARTTVVGASNSGSFMQAMLIADDTMTKEWLATNDSRTREDHVHAEGQIVSMNQKFTVGGWPMDHPGDTNAPAGEVINCRCTLAYDFNGPPKVTCECNGSVLASAYLDLIELVAAPVAIAGDQTCVCPTGATEATSETSPLGLSLGEAQQLFTAFKNESPISPAYGGAKISKQLATVRQKLGYHADVSNMQLLQEIDKVYTSQGGKNSFADAYAKWVEKNASKGKIIEDIPKTTPSIPDVPAPAFAEPRGLPTIPEPKIENLKDTGKKLGGVHGAKLYEDVTTGEKWVFKQADYQSDFAPKLDVATAKLQSRMGLAQPSTYAVRVDGKYGSLQSMHDAKPGLPNFDPTKLNPGDVLAIQREEILDWLISNNDAHSGNFLRVNGELVGIDKGQSFKYLMKDTKLDWNTVLHHPIPPDRIVYQTLWRDYAEGKDVTLFDPGTGSLKELIDQTMSIPDDEFKAYFRPFAEQAYKEHKLAYGEVEKFLDVITARKNNLATDFEDYYARAQAARAKALGKELPKSEPVPTPPVTEVPQPLSIKMWQDYQDITEIKNVELMDDVDFFMNIVEKKWAKATDTSYPSMEAMLDDSLQVFKTASDPSNMFLNLKKDDQLHLLQLALKKEGKTDLQAAVGKVQNGLFDHTTVPLPGQTATSGIDLATIESVAEFDKIDGQLQGDVAYALEQFTQLMKKNPEWTYQQAIDKVIDTFTKYADDSKLIELTATERYNLLMLQAKKNGNYTQAKIFKQFKESKAPVTEAPKPNPIPTEPPAPAPQVLDLLDISSVPDASVQKLFELYKQTKAVSPGWGGAAIYKNLQETKKLLTGEAWSNLNDGQLLKMLDKAYGKPGKTYFDETVSWLKTSNGKKYLADNKLPNLPDAIPKVAPEATTVETATEAVTSTVPDVGEAGNIDHIDKYVKMNVFDVFKYTKKISLNSTGPKLWEAIKYVKSAYSNLDLTDLQIIRIVDEVSATKFGVENTHLYEKKLAEWMKTPSGKKIVSGEKPLVKPFDSNAKTVSSVVTPREAALEVQRLIEEGQNLEDVADDAYQVVQSYTAKGDSELILQAQPWNPSEKAALKHYTTSAYHDMNGFLRGFARGEYGPTMTGNVSNMQKIIYAQRGMRRSRRPMLLHRGTGPKQFGLPSGAKIEDFQAMIGKTIQDPGFVSTSVGGHAAFSGTIMEIEAPTGSLMSYIQPISHHPSENEMLLAAGTKFKILEVKTDEFGRMIVRVRIVA